MVHMDTMFPGVSFPSATLNDLPVVDQRGLIFPVCDFKRNELNFAHAHHSAEINQLIPMAFSFLVSGVPIRFALAFMTPSPLFLVSSQMERKVLQ
jgi:uncharacterized membrane protein YraQ (UPF0718 family)